MNKIFIKMFLVAAIFTASSCETLDLDQLDNPSTLQQNQLDPLYVFNYIQLTLPDFVDSSNDFTQRIIRQYAMTGGNTYNNAFTPINFDANWRTAYLMLNAIKTMEPKAIEDDQKFILGASKIIRCYILMTMTDTYGDIPYSEALQGNANLRPKFDNSENIYAGVYQELNDAIAYLDAYMPTAIQPRDLYYGVGKEGVPDKAKWITLAKTLKLKMLNNANKVANIDSFNVKSEIVLLLSENNLIDTEGEDFAFQYGNERDVPNSRHPQYNDHYEFGTGAYIANYFFWAVTKEKGKTPKFDPREEFYFYKQAQLSSSNTNSIPVPCRAIARPSHYLEDRYTSFYDNSIRTPYCLSDLANEGSAYLGRDHGDRSGLPQDDAIRSLVGLYPAGGAFGAPAQVNGSASAGLKGALGQGIMPMLLSSYVSFMKAEIYLTIDLNPADAKLALLDGITKSIDKSTKQINGYPLNPPDISAAKATYLQFIGTTYDGLSNNERKLELIIKEYYIAAWGNGIEPYNSYRRTGYPSNLQPTLEEVPGPFFYTALYPYVSVNNNPNAPANERTKKVFWDVSNVELH